MKNVMTTVCVSLAFAILVPSIGTAQVTEIIDSTGDGMGNGLDSPTDIAVDGSGNAFVVGPFSLNAFMIESAGSVAEIIDESAGWVGLPTPAGPRHIFDGASPACSSVWLPRCASRTPSS